MHCATTLFTQSAAATRAHPAFTLAKIDALSRLSLSLSRYPLETWLALPKFPSSLSTLNFSIFEKYFLIFVSYFFIFHFLSREIVTLFKIVTREKKISSRILHSHALKARIRTRETRGKVEGVETGSNRQNIRFLLDLDRSYCTNLSIQIREQYTYTRKINKSLLRI